jgi:hypothetical protein
MVSGFEMGSGFENGRAFEMGSGFEMGSRLRQSYHRGRMKICRDVNSFHRS